MPVIFNEVVVTDPVAAKVKAAMEQKLGGPLTDAEAKAALRAHVFEFVRNDVRFYLNDKARADNAPDTSDVDGEFA